MKAVVNVSGTVPVLDGLAAKGPVRLRDGEPVTDTLMVAAEFGRPHKNVLRVLDSLIEDKTIDRLNFEPISYIDDMNRPQRAIELTELGATIVMPFVGGDGREKGRPFSLARSSRCVRRTDCCKRHLCPSWQHRCLRRNFRKRSLSFSTHSRR